ncbi:hypothetical protein BDR03DRAFT_310349 [Suillus americanus]|nr:hypothetical protein BDR03DRAFT_310349 [Suillus americanus]
MVGASGQRVGHASNVRLRLCQRIRRPCPSHTLLIFSRRFIHTDLQPLAMSEDHRPDSLGASRSSRVNVAESSNQPRRGIRQSLRKLKNALTKKLPVRFKRTSKSAAASAVQNVETEGVLSSQKVEDTLHLHPSDDNNHATTSEIPIDSMNQELFGEPASQVFSSNTLTFFSNFGRSHRFNLLLLARRKDLIPN